MKNRLLTYLKLFSFALLGVIVVTVVVSSIGMAQALTVPLKTEICCNTPADFGAAYEDITIRTTDGLALSGWYIPSRNGAAIILAHAYYGNRLQTLPVAQMLARHGFGVLMYDQRASGESEGSVRSFGWKDSADIAPIADWLLARPDVLPGKIGGAGCSMGGGILLAGAVTGPRLAALALEAPSPIHWRENIPQFSTRDPLTAPIMAGVFGLVILRSGALPPTTTTEAIQAYSPRPLLLISTGQAAELQRMNEYAVLASESTAHWNIPNASHCGGAYADAAGYERHLVEFFTSTLLTP